MDSKKRKKYKFIAKITGILAACIVVLGTSYAVFRTVTRGEQDSVISAGKLDVRIENEQDEMTLENAFPITEEEGLKQTPYTFDVVNEGTINAEYDLYIEIDESVSTLPVDVVRYYLTVEENGVEKIVTSSSRTISQEEVIEKEGKKLYKIDNKYLDTTKSNHYKLYLWIDENATTEEALNKRFEAKVSIEAVQIYDQNRLVQQIDVSQNGDGSAIAYMYANGNVVIKGQGQIKDDLSDTLVYTNEKFLDIYKKVFIAAGAPAEDVESFTSLQEFQDYLMNLQQEDPELYQNIISQDMNTLLQLVLMQDVLESLGYNTNGVELTQEAYMAYLVEQGLMNESGQFTEEGQEFYTKFEETANSLNSPTTPAKSIVLEDGITNIPEGLFTGNEDITEVRIPASVTSIDDKAFYGCIGLTEIVLPSNISNIGMAAFGNCTSLESINIPSKVTTIESNTFSNCQSLTAIELPNTILEIGSGAFSSCKQLTKLVIPESTTVIGDSAFSYCTGLTYLSIPGTIPATMYMFSNVSNLETVEITGSGKMADYNNTNPIHTYKYTPWYNSRNSIKSITIHDGITSIGNYAFYQCTNLNTIEIADTVTTIGTSAFTWCTGLTTIKIPASVTNITTAPFLQCSNLKEISVAENNTVYTSIDGVLYNKDATKIIRCPQTRQNITLPNNLVTIGDSAFSNCNKLTSITVPESVTTIEDDAFSSCTGLTYLSIPCNINYTENTFNGGLKLTTLEITGKGAMTDFTSTTYKYTPWYRSYTNTLKNVIIKEGVTTIGDYAFYDNRPTNIETIKLPNSLKSIGNHAFDYCSNLQSIDLPANLLTIGDYAFEYCSKLQSIDLPANLVTIGRMAFNGCTSITAIEIPVSVTSIGNYAFSRCTGLTYLSIPGTINYDDTVLSGVTNLKTIEITGTGNMVDYVDSFSSLWHNSKESIQEVIIHEGITSIGNYAFYQCTNLTTIEIPDSVTSIGKQAFRECTSLTSIDISNSVKSIGDGVFFDWVSSQTINIDNTEAYITENWDEYWNSGCDATINYLRT